MIFHFVNNTRLFLAVFPPYQNEMVAFSCLPGFHTGILLPFQRDNHKSNNNNIKRKFQALLHTLSVCFGGCWKWLRLHLHTLPKCVSTDEFYFLGLVSGRGEQRRVCNYSQVWPLYFSGGVSAGFF